MKVYISADMEGVTGVTLSKEVLVEGHEYEHFRRQMTADVNAAVEGAISAGATEVLVNDGHWRMSNLLLEELHPAAQLIRGNHVKTLSMMEGIDSSFAVALFVGYHAMVGHSTGIMNETFWGREVLELRLNGEPIGEFAMNAGIAGAMGVPVGMVSGDDAIAAEARNLLGEAVEVAIVKQSIERFTAICLPPKVTAPMIRDAARRAVDTYASKRPWVVEGPVEFEIDWASTAEAATAALIPGVARVRPRTTSYRADSYMEAFRGLLASLLLGRSASDPYYG